MQIVYFTLCATDCRIGDAAKHALPCLRAQRVAIALLNSQ